MDDIQTDTVEGDQPVRINCNVNSFLVMFVMMHCNLWALHLCSVAMHMKCTLEVVLCINKFCMNFSE